MSKAVIARFMVVMALLMLVPAKCSDSWVEKPDQVFDAKTSRFVPGTRTASLGAYALDRDAGGGVWAVRIAMVGVVCAMVLALFALVSSLGGHGTNSGARYSVLAAVPVVLGGAIYGLSDVPDPWAVRALWPTVFFIGLILLFVGVAALPKDGPALQVPPAPDLGG